MLNNNAPNNPKDQHGNPLGTQSSRSKCNKYQCCLYAAKTWRQANQTSCEKSELETTGSQNGSAGLKSRSVAHTRSSARHWKMPRKFSNFTESLRWVEDVYWWSQKLNKLKIEVQMRNPESDGVLLGFSQNELKWESTWITTKNGTVRAYVVIQRAYLHPNQSPTTPMSQQLEGSPQIHKRRGNENQRTQDFRISTSVKTEIEKWPKPVGHIGDLSSD
jgi:hypothetical protein